MKRILYILCCLMWVLSSQATTYERHFDRMTDYFNHAEWDDVLKETATMVKMQPTDVNPYAAAIIAAQFMEDTNTENFYLRLSQSNIVHIDSLLQNIYHRTRQLHNAQVYEQLLLNLKKNNRWLSRVFNIYLLDFYHFSRRTKETISVANELLKETPDNLRFLKIKANALFYQGNTIEAAELYEKILNADSNDYEALTFLGAYYASKDYKTIAKIDSIYLKDTAPVDSVYLNSKKVIFDTRVSRTIDLMQRAHEMRPSDHLVQEMEKLQKATGTLPKHPSRKSNIFDKMRESINDRSQKIKE